MLELRLRTREAPSTLLPKTGMVLGSRDYDLLLTGAARVLMPNGRPLCVYLPGILTEHTTNSLIYGILHDLRQLTTNNRADASGSQRITSGTGKGRTLNISSGIIGAVDAIGMHKTCRLTAWTGRNLPQFTALRPLLRAIAVQFSLHEHERYAHQAAAAARSHPDWIVPDTPFSTITVNNTYPTGMHKDAGDLDEGFSTLACLRRGDYTGGRLLFPEWRTAVDMQDGDLLLMDAHQWHANTPIVCGCGNRLTTWCRTCPAERISVVSYFRTKITECGTPDEERAKAHTRREVGK